MSFDVVCSGCGAPSSSSVGVCPYCKGVFSNSKSKNKETPLITKIRKNYKEGKLDKALFDCDLLYRSKEKLKENNSFLKLYVNVLLESEGPPSKIRSLLSLVMLNDPSDIEAIDLLDILEARDELSNVKNDTGEQKLKNIIKRSPNNAFAYFLLGSHLFWVDKDYEQAVIYLEMAVKKHPTFVRAWGCLGAIYKQLGNETLSKRSFATAVKLETNPQMKKYLKNFKR